MAQEHVNLQCPRCGSHTVDEFRMGTNRYRITENGECFQGIMRGSEDPIFHRCVDCGYGSDTEIWEREGRSDFASREEACK